MDEVKWMSLPMKSHLFSVLNTGLHTHLEFHGYTATSIKELEALGVRCYTAEGGGCLLIPLGSQTCCKPSWIGGREA